MTWHDQSSKPFIRRLVAADETYFEEALDVFEAAFDDRESYGSARPSVAYRQRLLSKSDFVFLVALVDYKTVGALAAYELKKFEQERSEFYIYDLAVSSAWRRKGVATALIEHLKVVALNSAESGVFVQAEYEDEPAIALYTKLGIRENVIHFDIVSNV